MKPRLAPLLLAVPLAGCRGHSTDLMPLEIGRERSYTVRAGIDTFVEPIRITAKTGDGYDVVGPLGPSRLAWRDGTLVAYRTANARFTPPLPILDSEKRERTWSGWIEANGKRQPAKATLTHEEDTPTLGGRKLPSTLAVVEVKTSRTTIELRSWFRPKEGLIQQEQRTGGRLDVAMEAVGD